MMQKEVARYRKQIKKNPARGRVLRLVEEALETARQDATLATLLAERLQALEASGARADLLNSVGQQRFEALMRHAESGEESLEAAHSALQAAQYAQDHDKSEAVEDAALWALVRGASDKALCEQAINFCGGIENARGLCKSALKSIPFKERKGALRHALSILAEQAGETDTAFFEALRAARSKPPMRRYLDEAFRLALMTGRFEEVALVFQDAIHIDTVPSDLRNYLRLKLAHLLAKNLDRGEDALDVYAQVLRDDPDHEKALKRANKLAEKLGVEFHYEQAEPASEAYNQHDEQAPDAFQEADPVANKTRDLDLNPSKNKDHNDIEADIQNDISGPGDLHDLTPDAVQEIMQVPPVREGTDVFSAYDESKITSQSEQDSAETEPVAGISEIDSDDVFSQADDAADNDKSGDFQLDPKLLAQVKKQQDQPEQKRENPESVSLPNIPASLDFAPEMGTGPDHIQDAALASLEQLAHSENDSVEEEILDDDLVSTEDDDSLDDDVEEIAEDDLVSAEDDDNFADDVEEVAEDDLVSAEDGDNFADDVEEVAEDDLVSAEDDDNLEDDVEEIAEDDLVSTEDDDNLEDDVEEIAEDDLVSTEDDDNLDEGFDDPIFSQQETAPHPSLPKMQQDMAKNSADKPKQRAADQTDIAEDDGDDNFAETEIGTGQILESSELDNDDDKEVSPQQILLDEDFDPVLLEQQNKYEALAKGLAARLPAQASLTELLRIGEIYESRLGQPGQAFAYYARALELDDHEAAEAGVLRCAPGAGDEALALYQQQLTDSPEQSSLLLGLAKIIAASAKDDNKPRQAIEILEPLFAKNSQDAGIFRQLDRLYRDTDQPEKRANLRSQANFGDAATRLGMLKDRVDLLEEAGKLQAALSVAHSVKAALPRDPGIARRIVQLAEKNGGAKIIRESLQQLIELVEEDEAISTSKRLVDMARQADDLLAEREAWQHLLVVVPDNAEALRSLSDLLENDGAPGEDLLQVLKARLKQARASHNDAQELLILHRLADAQHGMGDLEAEQQSLEQALLVDPDDDNAIERIDASRREQNNFKALAELYIDLAKRRMREQDKVSMWLAAAQIYGETLDKKNKARNAFQKALDLEPNNGQALGGLANLYLLLGDPEAAVVHLERATRNEEDPSLADNLFRLAQIYETHLMRGNAAVKTYQRVLAVQADHQEAGDALAKLYLNGEEWDPLVKLQIQRAKKVEKSLAAEMLAQAADISLRKLQQRDRAFTLAERGLKLDPTSNKLRETIVDLLIEDGDFDEALGHLQVLHQNLGDDGTKLEHLVALAQAYQAQDNSSSLQKARDLLLTAQQRSPAHLGMLRALAALLLSDGDSEPNDIIAILEQRLLHHGPDLQASEAAGIHGRIGILKRGQGDLEGARQALQRAMSMLADDEVDADILAAHAELLIDEEQFQEAYDCIVRLAENQQGSQAAARWIEAGHLAEKKLDQAELALQNYEKASELDPLRLDAIEAQVRIQVSLGHSKGALQAAEALLDKESDPVRLSKLELAVATICRDDLQDDERAADLLRRAIQHDPNNIQALRAAEVLFEDLDDSDGLEEILSTAIKAIPNDQLETRIQALERLAQLRRYTKDDLPGAVTALEEILTLDDSNDKAREDLARLYDQLGESERSLRSWREILRRNALSSEAYRAIFGQFRRHERWDEAYCIAATMTAVDLADNDVRAISKRLRPPFPNWPKVPKDAKSVQAALVHPGARGVVADLLRLAAPAVWPEFARSLRDFGLRRRDLLNSAELPASVKLAIRQASRMLDLPEPQIYRGGPESFGISLLPINPPALLIGPDVLRGGMTPERAFAFGRAFAYIQPARLLSASLSTPELRGICEAVLLRAMPKAEQSEQSRSLNKTGQLIEKRLPDDARKAILDLGRKYYHLRNSYTMQTLVSATAFGADRVGFLFAGELAPSVAAIKAAAGEAHLNSARLAIKELVNFSVGVDYMLLRQQLGLRLSDKEAAPVLSIS